MLDLFDLVAATDPNVLLYQADMNAFKLSLSEHELSVKSK